jgi:hypothetical protein
MTSIAQWSTTKVTLLAAAWVIAVPAALVAVVRLIAWHRMAAAPPGEPYWASVDVGGWWVPLVWFVPPVALIAVRIWSADGSR